MSAIGFSLDLSSPKGSFSLYIAGNEPEIIAHCTLPGSFTHSEKLLGHLESSLKDKGIAFDSIVEWVTSRGPGSFTGLRIAFATLKAFVTVSGKPLITVEGPEARGFAYLKRMETPLWPRSLVVLSHLTAERYVLTEYKNESGVLSKKQELIATQPEAQAFTEGTILIDSRIPKNLILNPSQCVVVDLDSQQLCSANQLKTRQVFDLSVLHSVVPSYFGSSHFD